VPSRLYTSAAICFLWACSPPASNPVVAATNIRKQQVHFRNGDITLAGTLFLPAGSRVHPAVVLFHGSGPEPRNTFMGRWFAEQGIAALTYDKRGVGESTGDFKTVPFQTLVDDGLAAIAFLKARADIESNRIGVWGLSQGGWLGPLAASRSKDVAFVIAVSGPGVSPGEQMIFYYGTQLRDQGVPAQQVAEASDLRRKVWRYLSTGEGYDEASTALQQAQSQPWFAAIKEQPDGLFAKSPASKILDDPAIRAQQWFKFEIDYDPRSALRKLTVPALFLFGGQDELVPVQRSADIIRQTLTESGHRDFTIKTFPDADHNIRLRTPDGRPFAPGYLDTMREWARSKVAPH
jgi:dienelactone hydrolase